MKKVLFNYLLIIVPVLTIFSCNQAEIEEIDNHKLPTESVEISVALNKEDTSIKPKISVRDDKATGVKEEWNEDDKLSIAYYNDNGMLKLARFSPKKGTIRGDHASFVAQLPKGDVSAFKKSRLYAVNDNDLDSIFCKIDNNKLSVRVGLFHQKGTLSDIPLYDLLYAEGDANSSLIFHQQMSIIRFDLQLKNQQVNQLNTMSLFFLPENETVEQHLFGKSVVFNYGDLTSGSTSKLYPLTFLDMKNINRSLDKEVVSMYVVLPERKKMTGTLSIELNAAEEKSYRKYIQLKNKSFLANKVVAKKIVFGDNDRVPNVCDYLYNDGTWGPLKDYGQTKYPVALVFSNQTSSTDRNNGFTHGYAVSLADASNGHTCWAPNNINYPGCKNIFENVVTAPLRVLKDLDGFTTCSIVYPYIKNYSYKQYNNNGFLTAIPVAHDYGTEAWRVFNNKEVTVPTPAGSSGWYLPSLGQSFLLYTNVAKLDKNFIEAERIDEDGDVFSFYWSFEKANENREDVLHAFDYYFNTHTNAILKSYYQRGQIPQSEFNKGDNWMMWTSSLGSENYNACAAVFNAGDLRYTFFQKQSGKRDFGFTTRAVVAF